MKKAISIFTLLLSVFFSTRTAFAGPDITLSPKTSTSNSITVTIKNNGPAGTSSTGSANSIFNGVVYAVNPSQHPDNSASVGPIVGGQSKDVIISGLSPATLYSIEVQEGGFYNPGTVIKKISVSTKTSNTVPACTAPRVLVNGTCIMPAPSTTTSSGTVVITTTTTTPGDQCHDGVDNDKDGKADQYGVDIQKGDGKNYGLGVGNGDGVIDLEPDPSCFSGTAKYETADDVVSTIIPCTDKCTFSDVFKLINSVINFFFTTLLIPIFVIILMYAGFKYITAEGNPSKIANLKKILGNIVLGIVIMLCAWLIVRTIMNVLLNDQFKKSGVEFLGN